tara:strand:+ start:241 stop:435 length:195 start_codon:yes stop_codon:yes gene_type:complete
MNYQKFTDLIMKSNIEKMTTKDELDLFANKHNLTIQEYQDQDWGLVYSVNNNGKGMAISKVKVK